MNKLTTREKIILVGAAIVVGVVTIKLKKDLFAAGKHYNKLADQLCSGGAFIATDITDTGFKLSRITIANLTEGV